MPTYIAQAGGLPVVLDELRNIATQYSFPPEELTSLSDVASILTAVSYAECTITNAESDITPAYNQRVQLGNAASVGGSLQASYAAVNLTGDLNTSALQRHKDDNKNEIESVASARQQNATNFPKSSGGGDSSWTSVRLLVPFDSDANSVTHSNGQSITGTTSGTSGTPASAVTSDSKYGSGGWTQYQGTVTYSTSTFNSTNWTVEFWFKRNADYSFTTYRQVMKFGYFIFRHSSSNNFELYDDDDGSSVGGFGAAALNTWEHYAIVYQNGTTRLYKGGSQIASSTGTLSAPSSVVIGRSSHGLYNFSLDDLRVTDAARYPDGTTFTAPSAAHPTSSSSSNVSLKYDQETLGYLSQVLQVAQNANTGATIKDAAGTSVTLTLAELKHVIATMVSNNQSLVEARNKAAIDIDAATTNTAVTNVKTTFTTTYPPPSGS